MGPFAGRTSWRHSVTYRPKTYRRDMDIPPLQDESARSNLSTVLDDVRSYVIVRDSEPKAGPRPSALARERSSPSNCRSDADGTSPKRCLATLMTTGHSRTETSIGFLSCPRPRERTIAILSAPFQATTDRNLGLPSSPQSGGSEGQWTYS